MKINKEFSTTLFEIMFDFGFMLVHTETGKQINVGDNKDFKVTRDNESKGKEYATLKSAMVEATK